jgi:D-3-phosphoglycerate dehydrogenase / 2-oxoglutarate reductase
MAGVRRVLVEPPVFPVDGVRELFAGSDVAVEARPRPWNGDDVVGLLVWQAVSEADMARLPALRVIATGSTGFDHIDTNAAKRRRIWVCNVPEYCVEEVADSTIALLLALLRGVVVLDRSVRAGVWDDHAGGVLPRVSDTRLGIAGFGRIGRAVARRARGLGIETWASDPVVPAGEIAAAGVTPVPFQDLLRGCGAVTLHLPLTKDSEHLIGARELALMPPGSYLINAARGPLVDLDAMLAALDSGQLAGAAIDVLPVEPPAREYPVPSHPHLIVTPHAAWYSLAAEGEVVRQATHSVRAVLEGREPEGVVVRPPP